MRRTRPDVEKRNSGSIPSTRNRPGKTKMSGQVRVPDPTRNRLDFRVPVTSLLQSITS
jgi:hypothetical protein